MSKSPTPGPWSVRSKYGQTWIHAGKGKRFTQVADVSAIEIDTGEEVGADHEQIQANARLLAAAPELLAALIALADKVDATSDCDHKRFSCAEVGCIGAQVKAARAAIAKAGGRS